MKARESFVLQNLPKLELAPEQYIVVGSGVLDVLGVRKANDIDFVTSPKFFEELKDKGWKDAKNSPSLVRDDFEAYLAWDSMDGNPNFEDLMITSDVVQGYNFVHLNRLLDWKRRVGRPKDITDIGLVEEYLKTKII